VNRHSSHGQRKENDLVIVLSLAMVLGMVVALAVYFGWRSGGIVPGLNHPLTVIALVLCPPFILSLIVAPAPDSDLAVVLVVGTIVFANAFLYGGAAAGVYFVVSLFHKRKLGE
jgi:hypothetical protein